MRQSIRAALKQGAENIAVVCGAWHAPALQELGPAAPDQRTLRGLPKVKVAATWVPWTYGLLARDSGYGAGVDSPGLVRPALRRRRGARRALARARRAAAARGGARRVRGPGRRRDAAGGRARRHPRPAAGGPRRAAGRHARRALPRLRRPARARPRASSSSATGSARCPPRRRWCRSSRTSRGCSGGCGSSPRRRSRTSRSTCAAPTTASAAGSCTA